MQTKRIAFSCGISFLLGAALVFGLSVFNHRMFVRSLNYTYFLIQEGDAETARQVFERHLPNYDKNASPRQIWKLEKDLSMASQQHVISRGKLLDK